MKNNFEDSGMYYATPAMMDRNLIMSLSSRIVYDIIDGKPVKISNWKCLQNIIVASSDFYQQAMVFKVGSNDFMIEI